MKDNTEPILLDLFKNNCELNLRLSIIDPINITWKFKYLNNFESGNEGIHLANMKSIINVCSIIFKSNIIYKWKTKEIIDKIENKEYIISIVDSFYVDGHIYYSKMHKNTMIVIYGYTNGYYNVFINRRMLGLEKAMIKKNVLERLIYRDRVNLKNPGIKDFVFTQYPNTTLYIQKKELLHKSFDFNLDNYYLNENCGFDLLQKLVWSIEEIIKCYHSKGLDYILVYSLANIIEVKKIHCMIHEYNRENMLLIKYSKAICECLLKIKFAFGKYLYTNKLVHIRYIKEQLMQLIDIERECKKKYMY